jgi:hypothetical protein
MELKLGIFLIREGILISGVSEAMDKFKKGGTAQEVHEMFL